MKIQTVSSWIDAPGNWTISAFLVVSVITVVVAVLKRKDYIQRVNKVPGMPGGFTILGNTTELLSAAPHEIFDRLVSYVAIYKNVTPVFRTWTGPFPLFFVYTAEAFEVVLNNSKLIDKSREYSFLHPWLGTGLLTSTGSKWQSRRKLLTPAFHFQILENFLSVFNEQSAILVRQLDGALRNQKELDVYSFVTRCTLDIICDTAMGCHVKAQTESESDYVKAVAMMTRVVQTRQSSPWLQLDFIFHLSPYGAEQRKSLKILHGFTNQVISQRRMEREKEKQSRREAQVLDPDGVFASKKRRLAFLDLLIEASDDAKILSDADIREEVDTFMFEGHDTTAVAICWSLFLIGSHPKVQELVSDELDRVIGPTYRPLKMADLSELKYLECCIKETLRLYPSVPFMGRKLVEDTFISGYNIPGNSTVLLSTYTLHRDPEHFPDPELYQPERFLPENNRQRHPYAYVPFSAGARNCIGQKFALMEVKVILSSILHRFHIESLDKRDELVLLGELILRPRDGIRLRFTPKSGNQA